MKSLKPMPALTLAAIAHELRVMWDEGVPLMALAVYWNMPPARIVSFVVAHANSYPTLPAFNGDTHLWRRLCRERLALALAGRVSFVFPLPD